MVPNPFICDPLPVMEADELPHGGAANKKRDAKTIHL
jgi:hypothetical protein